MAQRGVSSTEWSLCEGQGGGTRGVRHPRTLASLWTCIAAPSSWPVPTAAGFADSLRFQGRGPERQETQLTQDERSRLPVLAARIPRQEAAPRQGRCDGRIALGCNGHGGREPSLGWQPSSLLRKACCQSECRRAAMPGGHCTAGAAAGCVLMLGQPGPMPWPCAHGIAAQHGIGGNQ